MITYTWILIVFFILAMVLNDNQEDRLWTLFSFIMILPFFGRVLTWW